MRNKDVVLGAVLQVSVSSRCSGLIIFCPRVAFHHPVVVVVSPVVVEPVFTDCLSEQSRSQESINDERRMQALMSLSQRRVDKTQQPLTPDYCLLLFLLQRPGG